MSKLVLNANGMIVKAVVEKAEDVVTVEETLSMGAHKGHANAIIRNIHKMVPVIEGIILRAAQDKESDEMYLYGERFHTTGSNNPNARALMEFAADFDTNEQAVVQFSNSASKFSDMHSNNAFIVASLSAIKNLANICPEVEVSEHLAISSK